MNKKPKMNNYFKTLTTGFEVFKSAKEKMQGKRKRIHLAVRILTWLFLTSTSGAIMSSPAADLPLGQGCPVVGSGGIAYLSQYVAADKTGFCDAAQVQNVIFQLGQTGTLVVDMSCTLKAGLRLPSRFVLKGLGLGVAGQLTFLHDGIALSGCPESPHGYITISDLDIYGPNAPGTKIIAPHAVGIALNNQHIVFLDKLRVSNFMTGISGRQSYSVFINHSNVSDNSGDNIRIDYDANSWCIRDSLVSRAGAWGINILGPGDANPLGSINSSNDLLIDGLRMEYNASGAVRVNNYGTRMVNSRLELNGRESISYPYRALFVDAQADQTRILTNYFSGNCIHDNGIATIRAFNIPSSSDTEECQQLPISQ